MSDYRRFVAYLYEYPDNRKGPNCGFVRVESRNGYCRMNFQLKVSGISPDETLSVYAFLRRDSRLYGIPLGELTPGRTGISGYLFTRSDQIGDTPHDLASVAGLILLSPSGRVFATQWDDIPIQPQFFEPLVREAKAEQDTDAASLTPASALQEEQTESMPETSENQDSQASQDATELTDTSELPKTPDLSDASEHMDVVN